MLVDNYVEKITSWKQRGLSVAYSQGVFDLLHEGHIVFLSTAAKFADRLIVGVDSDHKVRLRKGSQRPVETFHKRVEALLKQNLAHALFKKEVCNQKWAYLRDIKPDFWVVTCDIYNAIELSGASAYVNQDIVVLPRLPTVSTTQLIHEAKTRHLSSPIVSK